MKGQGINMDKLKKLYDERAKAWEQAQDIRSRSERENLDAETSETWTRALEDVDRLSREIEQHERTARMESLDLRGAPAPEPEQRTAEQQQQDLGAHYERAFGDMIRRGAGRLSPADQDVLERGYEAFEGRAQAAGVDAAGGYTVPEGFRNKMVEGMKAYGGLLSIVEVINTSTGARLPWPTNDDTANEGALLSENTQVTEQDLTFGQDELNAYTYTSKMVRVSLQLLQDSAFNLDSWLPSKLGVRIGRAVAGHLATGTGSAQPQGVVNFAAGKTGAAGQLTTVTYDDLIDLEHSVDVAYRGSAQYALNDLSVAMIRKLKDSQNRPLWVPSLQVGVPSTINGRAYTVDNKLPAPGASNKSIFFGDFRSGVVARNVLGTQVLRLAERYADYLQVGFLGFSRWDAVIQDTAAVRAYAHPAA